MADDEATGTHRPVRGRVRLNRDQAIKIGRYAMTSQRTQYIEWEEGQPNVLVESFEPHIVTELGPDGYPVPEEDRLLK